MSSGYVARGATSNDLQFHATTASARISALVRFALEVDVAIVDLRAYAERQRRSGAAEKLRTDGAFLALDLSQPSEEQLWRLAEPAEAQKQEFGFYACVPIRDAEDRPLGRIAVIANEDREFDTRMLETLRAAADLVADLIR